MTSHQGEHAIRSIVIAGGGAAGWLTAAIIAAEHNLPNNPHLNIALVESPDVKILGVGEGTWPTMRDTLRKIGIDETHFLLSCDASFKQGTRFVNWRNGSDNGNSNVHCNGNGSCDDVYDHPFGLPAGFFEADIAAWFLLNQTPDTSNATASFAQQFSTQSVLSDNYKAPKQLQTPAYAAVANYGYHLNAHKFAELLKNHSINVLGINYVQAHIDKVITDENDNISALQCKVGSNKAGIKGVEGNLIKGDLFVDCTGFAAKLIGEHYQQGLTSVSDGLKNDTAMAVQAAYRDEEADIASVTLSTAHENGWIWDIGLPNRKGVGCVFSSEFCSDDKAVATLTQYLKNDPSIVPIDESAIRKISFTPGYRKSAWVKNCVAVGTAAGFVEPLEASALVMVELSAKYIASQLPENSSTVPIVAKQFNQNFSQRWQRIVDFLKLHYVMSRRDDSPYWRDMSKISTASTQLSDWLAQWQHRPIAINDFMYAEELFPAASYMYVLYGMQSANQVKLNSARYTDAQLKAVQVAVQHNYKRTQQQLAALPTNRELINSLRQQAGI